MRSLEAINRHPAGLISVPVSRDFALVSRPPVLVLRLARPLITLDNRREMVLYKVVVPHPVTGYVEVIHTDGKALGVLLEPAEKRPPHLLGLLGTHAMEAHRQLQRVVPSHANLLAPILVVQLVAVEPEKALQQLLESLVAIGLDSAKDESEVLWQRVRPQSDFGDDAECAASAAA